MGVSKHSMADGLVTPNERERWYLSTLGEREFVEEQFKKEVRVPEKS